MIITELDRAKLSPKDRAALTMIEREEKRLLARENLQDFIEYMMPAPAFYEDPLKTRYVSHPVHKLMVKFWEEIDSGRSLRSALSVPPQTGKTTHTTLMGSAWSLGRRPDIKIINGTYNETRAKINGTGIRNIINSARYREVFPELELEKGGKSRSFLTTTDGGYVLMAGRGTGVTGQPCDIFNIDDPVKDKAEANSTAALEETWNWFSTTVQQRCHVATRIVINHTRWALNDLIGRICDPEHPDYDEETASVWTYLNVKAYNNTPQVAEILGIKTTDYLWPEKFPPELLAQIARTMSPEDFSALYMGKPVPDEGGFFRKDMIQEYLPGQLPAKLRIYAASDHAVTVKQHSDYTVLLIAGVDESGQIWLLDCVRAKMESDKTVEEMIRLMKKWRPITWWAARDHISKSIGPFLKARMRDEGCYATYVAESPETGDKMQKAQSIRGMMAMGMVRFPRKAPWYSDMINELLRFRGQGDAKDDFVDTLGHLGRGLEWLVKASPTVSNDSQIIKPKTLAWVMAGTAQQRAAEAAQKARAGW